MKNEILKAASHIPNVSVDTHLDFKLEDWPASAALITLCLSGVIIYWIKVWGEVNTYSSSCGLEAKPGYLLWGVRFWFNNSK